MKINVASYKVFLQPMNEFCPVTYILVFIINFN